MQKDSDYLQSLVFNVVEILAKQVKEGEDYILIRGNKYYI